MEDNLVEELRNSMHSFTEECLCPVCEGHGAISKAADSAVREWMPSAEVDGIKVESVRAAVQMGQSLNFTITGHFTAHDKALNQQSWEKIEGKAREEFEAFLNWLHNKWKATTSANFNAIKKAIDDTYEKVMKGEGAHPSFVVGTPQQIDQYEQLMKEKSEEMAKSANAYAPSNYAYAPWPGFTDEQKLEIALDIYQKQRAMKMLKEGGVT